MKKKMTIVLALALTLTMGIFMTGCGGSSGSGGDSGANATSSTPSIDLSQIDWTVEPGIVDGYRIVTFGYTNNTDYEIVDFDLEFKVKDDVTDEQLESYSELKEKASDMEHDIGEITIGAMTSKCVAPGESVKGCACNLDGTIEYYTDFDSYEVFEPDMLTAVFASDGKIYIAYYDCASGETTVGDEVEDAYTWSESNLARTLPKPDVRYLMISYDEPTNLSAQAYGVSKDDFDAYVEACKSNGFDQNVDADNDSFEADNADGVHVDVSYYSSEDEMYISAEKTDQ